MAVSWEMRELRREVEALRRAGRFDPVKTRQLFVAQARADITMDALGRAKYQAAAFLSHPEKYVSFRDAIELENLAKEVHLDARFRLQAARAAMDRQGPFYVLASGVSSDAPHTLQDFIADATRKIFPPKDNRWLHGPCARPHKGLTGMAFICFCAGALIGMLFGVFVTVLVCMTAPPRLPW